MLQQMLLINRNAFLMLLQMYVNSGRYNDLQLGKQMEVLMTQKEAFQNIKTNFFLSFKTMVAFINSIN